MINVLHVVVIATWWVVAPKRYVACIRKVPWLWLSAYPLSTKAWFPTYLRVFGLLLWAVFVLAFFYWH